MATHLDLADRSARIRALRGSGLPLEGGWRHVGAGPVFAELALRCAACGCEASLQADKGIGLLVIERLAIFYCEAPGHGEGPCCEHLQQVLRPESEEVLALWALERLAGER